MKNKKLIIGISAAAAVLVVGGGIWFALGRDGSDNDENVVYVTTVESLTSQGNVAGALNRFAGVVETQEKLEIQPNQEKTVKEIYVEEGQEVEVGTPLFSYDTENDKENLSKAQLELERISNTIGNKYNEIAALEKEKRNASSDAKLDYTLQIQSAQMELKQSEYEKKSKQVEIQKLQDNIENAEVVSEMAGVVQSINNGNNENMYYYGESQAFMTIIAMGDFRVKGKINEQNMGSIMPGQPVIVHSRLDDDKTWKGTISKISNENTSDNLEQENNGGEENTSGSSASRYSFYVTLNASDGLMIGQHVYIEPGEPSDSSAIWLYEDYIVKDGNKAYVWIADRKNILHKQEVTLGRHNDENNTEEIVSGLKLEDYIAYPSDSLQEGQKAALSDSSDTDAIESGSGQFTEIPEDDSEEIPIEENPVDAVPAEGEDA